ncbi:Ribokinase-like protein [Aspergillus heterothallicus]
MTLQSHGIGTAPSISFLSLGLVVLDEIRLPNRPPLTNILGGSGAYATLGARLFLPPPSSKSVGWTLHVGNDFPEPIQDALEKWDVTLYIERKDDRPSTRGLLEYRDTTFGPKTFKYTTTPLPVSLDSLKNSSLLKAKAFHFLESPQSITERVLELLACRSKFGTIGSREQKAEEAAPLIIWEPAPLACKAENLAACLEAFRHGRGNGSLGVGVVDVFSPNHIELAALLREEATTDKHQIKALAMRMLAVARGPGINDSVGSGGRRPKPLTILVRAGEEGCLICSHGMESTWIPPFYKPGPDAEQNAKVVDPTGAGNAFLGGYAIGLLDTGCPVEAACYGAVAASFALEQVGMPGLERGMSGKGERWNEESVLGRLEEYRRSVSEYLRIENR